MPLTRQDQKLIADCLNGEPLAWKRFVERTIAIVYSVVRHTTHMGQVRLGDADIEDIAADVLARFVANDFRILRAFRGKSSLPTYVAVIARRATLEVLRSRRRSRSRSAASAPPDPSVVDDDPGYRLETAEEVDRLLGRLTGADADLVRSFYLESKSYRQISRDLGIPRNSVGPRLARLRRRLRDVAAES